MNDTPKVTKETTCRFERGFNAKAVAGFSIGAVITMILYLWIISFNMANKPFFMYKSDLFVLSVLFLPIIGLLIYFAIYSYINQSDYIIVSPK